MVHSGHFLTFCPPSETQIMSLSWCNIQVFNGNGNILLWSNFAKNLIFRLYLITEIKSPIPTVYTGSWDWSKERCTVESHKSSSPHPGSRINYIPHRWTVQKFHHRLFSNFRFPLIRVEDVVCPRLLNSLSLSLDKKTVRYVW